MAKISGKMLALFLLLMACSGHAQEKLRTEQGEISFNASTPLEDISATNGRVNGILDTEKGQFAVVLLVRDFEFERKLMQEHFNENYLESDRYPKAYFAGEILNYKTEDLSGESLSATASGELTIHGITRDVKTPVTLKRGTSGVELATDFTVRPEDYNIEIPRLVFHKIAEEVRVQLKLFLEAD